MTLSHRFTQLDVFTDKLLHGNPLAVVHDAQDMADTTMAAFARWTNLSEATFLLPPTDPAADYRVRIFTPDRELPFAGHPTLGSCHAWLQAGGKPKQHSEVVQQCGVGVVRVRAADGRLAFAAPPLRRSGPLDDTTLAQVARSLRIDPSAIVAHQWVSNGPNWLVVMLRSAAEVLELKPDFVAMGELEVGVIGPQPPGHDSAFEVRAFVPTLGVQEDPVTGSLNAGIAQWLIGAGLAPPRYVAAQGTALGRSGRVFVERLDADIWIGGHVAGCIEGRVTL
jgi:PhzF family phenazine biosynthesis protein